MSDKTNESTSALMDGEAAAEDLAVIQKLAADDEMKATWQRYHLASDCLKGNLPESINLDLHAKIHQALENEPTILAPKPKTAPAYLKPVAGFAIAASVTAAVILGVQNFQNDPTAATNTNTLAQEAFTVSNPDAQFVTFSEPSSELEQAQTQQALERMNRYMLNYNELKANSGVRGMPPYARMIGYEPE